MVSKTISQIKRFIPTPQTWRIITIFLLRLLLVLVILFFFKVIFFTNCLSVENIKACATSDVEGTNTLFAIGGILVAIVALIPTFWIEGKIRGAKEEVGQEILNEVKENMQRLSKAQMLIFDADRYINPSVLLIRDGLIQQVVQLWPAFKEEEYRKLARAFSGAVREEFYQSPGIAGMISVMQGVSIPKGQMLFYISKAIFYLEETVLNSENPDREGLVNLACMYGCAGRYDEMIRVIERAIKVDANARDDFQEAKSLSLLMLACGTDRRKIEKLGIKIGKELPLSKDEFVRTIKKVDLQNLRGYINFFAIKKHRSAAEEYVYVIKITAVDEQGQRSVCGLYLTLESKDSKEIPLSAGQTVSMEEFFDEVDKDLFVICYAEG